MENSCTNFAERLGKIAAIPITEEHIKAGVRKSPEQCPLANALHSLGFDNVKVYPRGIECDGQVVSIGPDIRSLIDNFDQTGCMEPRTLYVNQVYGCGLLSASDLKR